MGTSQRFERCEVTRRDKIFIWRRRDHSIKMRDENRRTGCGVQTAVKYVHGNCVAQGVAGSISV